MPHQIRCPRHTTDVNMLPQIVQTTHMGSTDPTFSAEPISKTHVRSLFKWAGGKTRLAPVLAPMIQVLLNKSSGRYFEPFIGGASIPPLLRPAAGLCGDINIPLIGFYQWLIKDHRRLFRLVNQHSALMNKRYYYTLRNNFDTKSSSLNNAAIFYALNRYCFNGIYRTNKNGDFNVPYNYKKRTKLPSADDFAFHSAALSRLEFQASDYRELLQQAKSGDVVYLDPPYPATSETAFFNQYSADAFSHRDLASECRRLDSIGCLWIMSNASTRPIRRLYRENAKSFLNQTRFVSCKRTKLIAREVIIHGLLADGARLVAG